MSKPKRMQTKSQQKRSNKKHKVREAKKRQKALRKRAELNEEKRINADTYRLEEEVRKIKNQGLTIRNNSL
jgi:hypothetical protein